MTSTMNQMLALIDRVVRGEEPAPTATVLAPIDWTLNERACWVPVFEDQQERANDDRARAWLAQLPAAN